MAMLFLFHTCVQMCLAIHRKLLQIYHKSDHRKHKVWIVFMTYYV
jgi:cytochrome oxidase Cu insertion factor (SCO1/SenC/PrrC family)